MIMRPRQGGRNYLRGIMVIAAISTAVQTGGIAVIRLSGEQSLDVAARLFTAKKLKDGFKPDPGYMYLGTIDAGGFCDKCYMVYFRGPASFTGEDVVEFHLHGGVRLAQGVLDACCAAGARPAERGEFTKRAFLNGKLALADAEGVIDMINADSRAALSAAYRLMEGELSAKVRIIQDLLFDTVTGLEATLDYPDEMEDEQLPSAYGRILQALEMLEPLIKGQSYGQMAKYGINAVLTGRTNVGKSSLMNKMLGSQRAIVTEKAGTTRDVITESLEHNGVKINLADTAGIRESADEIEQEGVKRAKNALSSADLVIFVQAADDMGDSPVEHTERTLYLSGEVHVPRSVNQVYAVLLSGIVPARGSSRRSDGYTALLLLCHPVHGGRTVMHLADLVGQTCVEQNTLRSSRLTGIDMRHDTDITGKSQIMFCHLLYPYR